MSFEDLGFTALFHDAFHIDAAALVEHLILENDIRPYAERAMLAQLVRGRRVRSLPRVTDSEVQTRFDAIRIGLDYPEAARTQQLIDECHVTPEAVHAAIETRLVVDKLVDRFIAGLARDAAGREAICREAFLDLGLRTHVIRAVGLGLLAGSAADDAGATLEGAGAAAMAAARRHLLVRHGIDDWPALVDALTGRFGLPLERIDAYVARYAAALEAAAPARVTLERD